MKSEGSLKLLSPAKINLFLQIIGKRKDGYHDLASLFQAVDLCDTLTLTPAAEDRLESSDPQLPLGESNLIWRAINLYRNKTGLDVKLSIALKKCIPMEAGLGGGSSNAATALWGVNRLLNGGIDDAQLMAWGAEIGSDVPFFFSQGIAYCTGRGEQVECLPSLWHEAVWIVKSLPGLSTPEVYRRLQLSKLRQKAPRSVLESFLIRKPIYFNDLEAAASELLPELTTLKKHLQSLGFKDVWLAGSGSSVIGIEIPGRSFSIEGSFVRRCLPIYRSPQGWYEFSATNME